MNRRFASLLAALAFALAAPTIARADDDGLAPPPAAKAAPSGPAVETVRRFYDAFQKSDFATMESLYAPDAHWQDTIFSADDRKKLMGVWRFELDPKVGGKVTYDVLDASGPDAQGNTTVKVRWRDVYKFQGNPIDHAIDATLTVDKDGKIVDHRETYSWSEWAHQAFPKLGGLVDVPMVRDSLQWFLRRVVYTTVALQNAKRDIMGPSTTPGFLKSIER